MNRRSRTAAALVALALSLAGCTETPAVSRSGVSGEPSSRAPAPVDQDAAALAAQKKAAGIQDCPVSDPTVAPVPGGLPDLVLSCLGGGRTTRLAGLRGRPMMINVWAQWCGPCREEAPYLTEVAKGNRSDLLILGVDFAETFPDKAIEFARAASWTYPQLEDTDKAIQAPLQILGPPFTLFVRADGTIAYRQTVPFRSAEQIRQQARTQLGVDL
ncbi:MAG: TlpA family protein disulfide reductase [Friedmanniella sp.]|nr:TlpA family protein disulfide reductase [Friedmanniella sp.]